MLKEKEKKKKTLQATRIEHSARAFRNLKV